MAPVTPAQFEELIVLPTDSLATAIIKVYVRLPVLLHKFHRYLFKSETEISDELCADIRERLPCPDEESEE